MQTVVVAFWNKMAAHIHRLCSRRIDEGALGPTTVYLAFCVNPSMLLLFRWILIFILFLFSYSILS